jgi:hypothetical protein
LRRFVGVEMILGDVLIARFASRNSEIRPCCLSNSNASRGRLDGAPQLEIALATDDLGLTFL